MWAKIDGEGLRVRKPIRRRGSLVIGHRTRRTSSRPPTTQGANIVDRKYYRVRAVPRPVQQTEALYLIPSISLAGGMPRARDNLTIVPNRGSRTARSRRDISVG